MKGRSHTEHLPVILTETAGGPKRIAAKTPESRADRIYGSLREIGNLQDHTSFKHNDTIFYLEMVEAAPDKPDITCVPTGADQYTVFISKQFIAAAGSRQAKQLLAKEISKALPAQGRLPSKKKW